MNTPRSVSKWYAITIVGGIGVGLSFILYALSHHPLPATSAPARTSLVRRVWRNSGCVARPRWTPRCGVLGRPASTASGTPCVLASRRPAHPLDEHHSVKPS